jgi:hypothetical protein
MVRAKPMTDASDVTRDRDRRILRGQPDDRLVHFAPSDFSVGARVFAPIYKSLDR